MKDRRGESCEARRSLDDFEEPVLTSTSDTRGRVSPHDSGNFNPLPILQCEPKWRDMRSRVYLALSSSQDSAHPLEWR